MEQGTLVYGENGTLAHKKNHLEKMVFVGSWIMESN